MSCIAGAQTSSGQSASTTQGSSSSGTKQAKQSRGKAIKDTVADNRRNYKSKKTGQVATPSGQEATGTNGTTAPNPKNAGKAE